MDEIIRRALEALEAARKGPPEIWISLADEETLERQAELIEERVRSGENLPLAGATIAVKDNIDVAGFPTTAACPDFAYRPSTSAPTVQGLLRAGGIVIGKTNMDQFATGLVGTRSPYGAVRNAVDPRYIAGGSSSGSAVAVALGQVDIGLGTDTAGSGRVPAALNGIVGVKPTRGLLSTTGVVPACASFDCVSMFATTVGSARAALAAAYVVDPLDYRQCLPRPRYRPIRRVGVPDVKDLDLKDEDLALWLAALNNLADTGVIVEVIDVSPFLEAGLLLYGGAFVAERYDAVGEFINSRPESVDPVVRDIVLGAERVPAHRLVRDLDRLSRLKHLAANTFKRIDALAFPTVPEHPTLEQVAADPFGVNERLGLYNYFCNPLDLCSVVVPSGRRSSGLPWGVTFYAPAFTDDALLHLASIYIGESSTGMLLPEPVVAQDHVSRRQIVVAGAHMRGEPLNGAMVELGGRFVEQTMTAPSYHFYALDTEPPKPGLVRGNGLAESIEVEVWSFSDESFAELISDVPSPMAIGQVELSDGRWLPGFICQPCALDTAKPLSGFKGWRHYRASLAPAQQP